MREIFIGWFLFIGVVVIAAVVFCGWVISRVAQALGRSLGLIPPRVAKLPAHATRFVQSPPRHPLITLSPGMTQCRIAGCRHVNPTTAKFCRHCGHAFPQPHSIALPQQTMFN